jgi:hypothetical protein
LRQSLQIGVAALWTHSRDFKQKQARTANEAFDRRRADFPRMDQIDFTGPFEVLSRIPNSTIHAIAKTKSPVRDIQGLILTPEISIAEAPDAADELSISTGVLAGLPDTLARLRPCIELKRRPVEGVVKCTAVEQR